MTHTHKNPRVTVDIIIEMDDGIVLIQRRNPPLGWALPGGFVEYGETFEASAAREAKEETSLDVQLKEQFHAYSDPGRDPRHHTITMVFIAEGTGVPKAADDAIHIDIFKKTELPESIVFDHGKIIDDYFQYREGKRKAEIFRYSALRNS